MPIPRVVPLLAIAYSSSPTTLLSPLLDTVRAITLFLPDNHHVNLFPPLWPSLHPLLPALVFYLVKQLIRSSALPGPLIKRRKSLPPSHCLGLRVTLFPSVAPVPSRNCCSRTNTPSEVSPFAALTVPVALAPPPFIKAWLLETHLPPFLGPVFLSRFFSYQLFRKVSRSLRSSFSFGSPFINVPFYRDLATSSWARRFDPKRLKRLVLEMPR